MDIDARSVTSPTPDRQFDAVNIDDPDVRLAAEALGHLRADFVSSPPDTACLSMSPTSAHPTPPASTPKSDPPEPLLSLLTTSHPLVASTIGGASSAYGGAKNFSPRFKSGAEYVEGYLTPIANTVNSVGRATGVEGGVRWFLNNRRQHDSDSSGGVKKRRKFSNTRDSTIQAATDQLCMLKQYSLDDFPRTPRRLSSTSTVETLPAYDEVRSPAYTETAAPQDGPRSVPPSAAWPSRLMMSTSGLSVSMSAESLRSLKYCLRWLRWTNDHMGRVTGNLKAALEEYENASTSATNSPTHQSLSPQLPQVSRAELANRINSLKGDIVKTLQDAINTVSKYAGGALPENARVLVRRHLTSLPQRFKLATMVSDQDDNVDSESALYEGAQKVLVLAKEGLDMVTQISGVVDGTIVSAEQWCERMGKRKSREASTEMSDKTS
ncbi:hypothetical protein CDD82_3144 [Ophiocordyceps australis]|uniref:Clock-controlled protein 8 n=1 Tax=Ophiocordyceps australis TaxID=1399860 RepID=A0A2C5YJI5_9HYPO|nr:hypothetical protein CDD82_3144 [Ophiocordyceps australis]